MGDLEEEGWAPAGEADQPVCRLAASPGTAVGIEPSGTQGNPCSGCTANAILIARRLESFPLLSGRAQTGDP